MEPREQLHHLVDTLPDQEVFATLRFVQFLSEAASEDPLAQLLISAPETTEDLSAGEIESLDRSLAEAEAGAVDSWDEVKKRLA